MEAPLDLEGIDANLDSLNEVKKGLIEYEKVAQPDPDEESPLSRGRSCSPELDCAKSQSADSVELIACSVATTSLDQEQVDHVRIMRQKVVALEKLVMRRLSIEGKLNPDPLNAVDAMGRSGTDEEEAVQLKSPQPRKMAALINPLDDANRDEEEIAADAEVKEVFISSIEARDVPSPSPKVEASEDTDGVPEDVSESHRRLMRAEVSELTVLAPGDGMADANGEDRNSASELSRGVYTHISEEAQAGTVVDNAGSRRPSADSEITMDGRPLSGNCTPANLAVGASMNNVLWSAVDQLLEPVPVSLPRCLVPGSRLSGALPSGPPRRLAASPESSTRSTLSLLKPEARPHSARPTYAATSSSCSSAVPSKPGTPTLHTPSETSTSASADCRLKSSRSSAPGPGGCDRGQAPSRRPPISPSANWRAAPPFRQTSSLAPSLSSTSSGQAHALVVYSPKLTTRVTVGSTAAIHSPAPVSRSVPVALGQSVAVPVNEHMVGSARIRDSAASPPSASVPPVITRTLSASHPISCQAASYTAAPGYPRARTPPPPGARATVGVVNLTDTNSLVPSADWELAKRQLEQDYTILRAQGADWEVAKRKLEQERAKIQATVRRLEAALEVANRKTVGSDVANVESGLHEVQGCVRTRASVPSAAFRGDSTRRDMREMPDGTMSGVGPSRMSQAPGMSQRTSSRPHRMESRDVGDAMRMRVPVMRSQRSPVPVRKAEAQCGSANTLMSANGVAASAHSSFVAAAARSGYASLSGSWVSEGQVQNSISLSGSVALAHGGPPGSARMPEGPGLSHATLGSAVVPCGSAVVRQAPTPGQAAGWTPRSSTPLVGSRLIGIGIDALGARSAPRASTPPRFVPMTKAPEVRARELAVQSAKPYVNQQNLDSVFYSDISVNSGGSAFSEAGTRRVQLVQGSIAARSSPMC